ncbi:MAG: hypothetical protein ABL958_08315, partial [Bdellovibrionia bacterium]
MKLQEYEISQNTNEPPRRYFTDNNHFDLVVWYADRACKVIIGFQLGYKENPLNTDDEHFLSHYPAERDPSKVEHGKTTGNEMSFPAPKVIKRTDRPFPLTFTVR